MLRDVVEDLRHSVPEVSTSVSTGWGAQLAERVNQGELDAAAVWLGRRTPLPKNTRGDVVAHDAPGALQAPIERFGLHVRRALAAPRAERAARGRRAA